jgi:iron(III) transport system substrate-binding protein
MRAKTSRQVLAIAVSTLIVGALAACSSTGSAPSTPKATATGAYTNLKSLVAAAKKEGEVDWYQVDPPELDQEIAKAFTAKYGIKANFTRLTTSAMQTRYSSEAQAGAVQADLIVASNGAFVQDASTQGWLTPIKGNVPGFPFAGFNPLFLHNDYGTPTLSVPLKVIAYNTDKISKADAPKDWSDLTAAKYKGQILNVDPASSDSFPQFWSVIADKYGSSLPGKIEKNVKQVEPDGGVPMVQQLASGEASIAIPPIAQDVDTIKESGAPVAFVIPPVTTGSEHVVGLSKDAPHPAAARLLADFLLSKQAAKILSAAPGTMSPYKGIGVAQPKGYVPSDPVKGAANAQKFDTLFGSAGAQ